MPRILVGECAQEVSSFNPVRGHYGDFVIKRGSAIVDFHRGLNTEMRGALDVFASRPDIDVAPTYSALSITSMGRLAQADFDRIATEFLDCVEKALPVDGVYLCMHGAMEAVEEKDPEGYILQNIRNVIGPHTPLVISMDLHGVPTERMLRNVDALTAYHTYPHVDFVDTGDRAARLLLDIIDGSVDPVMAFVTIPALVRGDELVTETGLFGDMIRLAQAYEAQPGGLAAGVFIGNPFTDVPELQSYSFVIRDGDAAGASTQAIDLGNQFWPVRGKLQLALTSVEDTVEVVKQASGTVILADAADATSSGASGDSNVVLRGLMESGYEGRVLAPIVDEEAVADAIAAGVGNVVRTTIGGKLDTDRFTPMPIEARVHMISEGRFISESNGEFWYSGLTAVLQTGGYTVIVTSRSVHLYDRSLFYAHGQDPKRFDSVIVKSPYCQRHMFDDWAERTINVDAPGATSADLPSLGHTVCPRPIYPLDREFEYKPIARIYQRPRT